MCLTQELRTAWYAALCHCFFGSLALFSAVLRGRVCAIPGASLVSDFPTKPRTRGPLTPKGPPTVNDNCVVN